jgi:hypothetical protein
VASFWQLTAMRMLASGFAMAELAVSITIVNEQVLARRRGLLYSLVQGGWPLGDSSRPGSISCSAIWAGGSCLFCGASFAATNLYTTDFLTKAKGRDGPGPDADPIPAADPARQELEAIVTEGAASRAKSSHSSDHGHAPGSRVADERRIGM